MPIHTVLGPIEPQSLGKTAMHEHLLIDARVWFEEAREAAPDDQRMTLANQGFVRWNVNSLEDNLVMDDPELAADEAAAFAAAGGSGIVDLSVIGLGRRIGEYPEIARRTGLHIMCGCGFYVGPSHPDWVEAMSVEELTAHMIGELRDGIEDTGVKPALIGEIGTSDPVTDRERRVVTAAGRAGAETGSAVNIHLDPVGEHALDMLEILTGEGMSPERVIFSHMDEHMGKDYHLAVAATGAVLEYDTFGSEVYFGGKWKDPTDIERMEYVRLLLDKGYGDQLVLSSDVWVKSGLRAYGGMGYDHILKRIVPLLVSEYGVTDDQLEAMLVTTPRRLLDRPAL